MGIITILWEKWVRISKRFLQDHSGGHDRAY